MLWKEIVWGVVALCLVLSLWHNYRSAYYMGQLPSMHSPSEWPMNKGTPCNCNKCIELSNLDWFCRKFDTSVNCLLTPENPEIPQGVLRWWLVSINSDYVLD